MTGKIPNITLCKNEIPIFSLTFLALDLTLEHESYGVLK